MIAIQKRNGVPTVLFGHPDDGFQPLDGEGWDNVVADGLGAFDGNPIIPVHVSSDMPQNASRAVQLIREISDRNDDASYRAAVKQILSCLC
jgi:hypothetical protein